MSNENDLPPVTPPDPIEPEVQVSVAPPPATPADPPPTVEAVVPEPAKEAKKAKGNGRKKGDFPNWVPTQYINKKDGPFESFNAVVDRDNNVITFTAVDSKGEHTYKVRCASIS